MKALAVPAAVAAVVLSGAPGLVLLVLAFAALLLVAANWP